MILVVSLNQHKNGQE